MAVGETNSAQASDLWNGTDWTSESMPSPGPGEKFVLGVSCTAATECTAVGMLYDTSWTMFAERWNGTAWSLQTIPAPVTEGKATEQSLLYGVACYSPTACTAVGTYSVELATKGPNGEAQSFYSGLAEHWNGTAWSQQALPGPTPKEVEEEPKGREAKDLAAVSCVTSASECTAVGANSGSINTTLAEHWNGTAWSVETTPTPLAGEENILDGVSCPSSTVCVAFGRGGPTTSNGLLAEVDPPAEMVQHIQEAQIRHRDEEAAAEKATEEKEANARKVREEEAAATKSKHEEEVAALRGSEAKSAAEKKFQEEEAASKTNEEKGAEIGPATSTAPTFAVVPFTPPAQGAHGVLPSSAKPLTEAQKLKDCKRLSKKKRAVCEAKVERAYSTMYGKRKKK
jgi:hypothetical protein